MATRPSLHEAVAGQKSKASDYNENFTLMMGYVEDSIDDNKTWTQTWTENTVDTPITTLAVSGTIALADKTINRIAPTGTVTFTLPNITDNTKYHQILVQMTLASTQEINLAPSGTTLKYFFGIVPDFSTTGAYDIIYEHDGSNWCVGAIRKA